MAATEHDRSADDGTGEGSVREAILRALERLLDRRPLDEIRVAHILEEANTSRATFYFYFSSKDDAFVALLEIVIDEIVPRFEALIAGRDTDDLDALRRGIATWLTMGGVRESVIRSAAEEWPRSAEVRRTYVRGIDRQAEVLTRAIDEDRAAGLAVESVPSPQLAAGLLWTMERVWYGALTGFDHLGDRDAVTAGLGDLVVASIYGR